MKKNLPVIVAIALPLLFVAAIAAALYVPPLFLHPQHDFLYTKGNYNGPYRYGYSVEDGTLVAEERELREGTEDWERAPALYRYDIETNTSRLIEEEDAEGLVLDPGPSDPDGYQVEFRYGNSSIFDLFGGGDRGGHFVTKGGAGKRLTGITRDNSWYGDFAFVGWITN